MVFGPLICVFRIFGTFQKFVMFLPIFAMIFYSQILKNGLPFLAVSKFDWKKIVCIYSYAPAPLPFYIGSHEYNLVCRLVLLSYIIWHEKFKMFWQKFFLNILFHPPSVLHHQLQPEAQGMTKNRRTLWITTKKCWQQQNYRFSSILKHYIATL